jgi:hypothetical protein
MDDIGFDLERDMLRHSLNSWIRFNIESEGGFYVNSNTVIILPSYDDEETQVRKSA